MLLRGKVFKVELHNHELVRVTRCVVCIAPDACHCDLSTLPLFDHLEPLVQLRIEPASKRDAAEAHRPHGDFSCTATVAPAVGVEDVVTTAQRSSPS